MSENLSAEEARVLAEMVERGRWHVRVRYDGPDPICARLVSLGLAVPDRVLGNEYIRRPPFPTAYRATPKGAALSPVEVG